MTSTTINAHSGKTGFQRRHLVWAPAIGAHLCAVTVSQLIWLLPYIRPDILRITSATIFCGQAAAFCTAGCLVYSARKNLGLRFIIGTVLGSFVFFVFLAAKILNASILNTAIMGFLIWLVFPLLASFVSSVSLRQPFLLLSRSNETDTDDFPSVPLRKMFLVTAGFAAVYSIARVVPNQYETANSLFTTSCGAIVIFVGLFALVAGPAFAALSTLRWETRALILIANTVCFGTIVPLTFELGAQYYAGFVLGVAYFQLMLFVSILPARLLGYRLRLVLPDSPTTELPDRFRPPNRDSGLPST